MARNDDIIQYTPEELELFWEPVRSKEELAAHMAYFLNIELPDCAVDENSTSTPMQFIWDVYEYMITGKGASRHVIAAARNSYKTLCTAIIQFYNLVHVRRDSVQLSAELQQSASALAYVEKFMKATPVIQYQDKDNTKIKRLVNLPTEWNWLTQRMETVLKVVTLTTKGANSSRASCLSGRTKVVCVSEGLNGEPVYYKRPIEDIFKRIKRGGSVKVLSVDENTMHPVHKEVVAVQRHIESERLVIKIGGDLIECTADHIFPVGRDGDKFIYKKAGELIAGDCLYIRGHLGGDISAHHISSITKKTVDPTKRNRWVYDIQVADTHLFFVGNSILTHNCLIFDELDLSDPKTVAEAAYIADPDRFTGFDPVSIYISSRKSNSGPLQALIDEYEQEKPNDLKLHLWSTVDTMKQCPESVCDSTKPAKAFLHMESLEVIWGEERFAGVVKEGRGLWKEINAFEDCAKCPAFIACQGRSKKQQGTQSTLRTHTFVGKVLKDVLKAGGPSMVVAQTLNLKPDSSSVVFSNFNLTRNVADYIHFYEWVAGHYYNPHNLPPEEIQEILLSDDPVLINSITPNKRNIYDYMKANGWRIHYGVDFGLYDPAVVVVVGYHKASQRCAILHIEASTGYPNEDWAKYIYNNVYSIMPSDLVCPDMADASAHIYFGRLKMNCRNKKPMSIETGVNQIKSLIFNPFDKRPHLMILDDGDYGQNKMLIEAMQKWTYRKTPTGYDFSKFEDNEFTHSQDATRYALDPFITETNVTFASPDATPQPAVSFTQQPTENFRDTFRRKMLEEHGVDLGKEPVKDDGDKKPDSKVKFSF